VVREEDSMNARGTGGQPPRVGIGEWVARVVAVVLLVPVRLAWEGLKAGVRAVSATLYLLGRYVLVPTGRYVHRWLLRPLWVFVRDMVWGWAIQHVLWGLVLTPLGTALLTWLLRPLLRLVEDILWHAVLRPALRLLLGRVLRPAARWTAKQVIEPVAWAIWCTLCWLCRWFVVWPLRMLWRWALRPLWLAIAATVYFGWRVATLLVRVLVVTPCAFLHRHVVRPVLAALGVVWRACVVAPMRWAHRTVLVPMNRFAADILGAVFGR